MYQNYNDQLNATVTVLVPQTGLNISKTITTINIKKPLPNCAFMELLHEEQRMHGCRMTDTDKAMIVLMWHTTQKYITHNHYFVLSAGPTVAVTRNIVLNCSVLSPCKLRAEQPVHQAAMQD